MKSDVFFLNARTVSEMASLSKIKAPILLGEIGFDDYVKPNHKVCIKTHFGALANTRYIRPAYTRFLVDHVKK
nr:4Fe-4S ferredoxin [Candidatus Sigynarchaeota archaeon]